MRWYRELYRPVVGAFALATLAGFPIGFETAAATQGKPLEEVRPFVAHGWTWSGWDAALMNPRTPEAQYNRGVMHATGHGQPQNDVEAVKWFQKAAEGGHALAQCNLGVMHATGRGVPQDNVQAWAWFDIAATQGDDNALENKELIAARMAPEELDRARQLARR